jgi:hypothetical protein
MSATTGVLISSAAWMALNFSRCVAIFGSSWSESRPPNTTFPPSPLAGLLGRTGRSRRNPPPTPNCPNLRGQTVSGARHPGPPPPPRRGTTPGNTVGATRGANPQRPAGKQFQGTACYGIYPDHWTVGLLSPGISSPKNSSESILPGGGRVFTSRLPPGTAVDVEREETPEATVGISANGVSKNGASSGTHRQPSALTSGWTN